MGALDRFKKQESDYTGMLWTEMPDRPNLDGDGMKRALQALVIDGVVTRDINALIDGLQTLDLSRTIHVQDPSTDEEATITVKEAFDRIIQLADEALAQEVADRIEAGTAEREARIAAVIAERERAQAAETKNANDIIAETQRAMGAEATLQANINAESSARVEGDNAERERAQGVEQGLRTDLTAEVTRAQVAENLKADKTTIDKTVMTNVAALLESSALSLRKEKVNVLTGTAATQEETLPLASSTNPGVMPKESFSQIATNTADIESLKGRGLRYYISLLSDEPTQAELMSAFQAKVGRTPNEGETVVDEGHGFEYVYSQFDGDFHKRSIIAIGPFGLGIAGTVAGKNEEGFLFPENDGSGSVVGFDALKDTANNAYELAEQARDDADFAVEKAEEALADAQSAKGTAEAAETSAGNAQTAATAAVSAANAASTTAGGALSTANAAAGDASTALSTANAAAGDASTALSTAQTANSTANEAKSEVSSKAPLDSPAFTGEPTVNGEPIGGDQIKIGEIRTFNTADQDLEGYLPCTGGAVSIYDYPEFAGREGIVPYFDRYTGSDGWGSTKVLELPSGRLIFTAGMQYSDDKGKTLVPSNISGHGTDAILTDAGTILALGSDSATKIYRSTDEGEIYAVISGVSMAYGEGRFIKAPNGNIILCGVGPGSSGRSGVWVSTDDGVTWTNKNISGGAIRSYEILDNGTILIATRSSLWKTTDNGATFIAINGHSGGYIQHLGNGRLISTSIPGVANLGLRYSDNYGDTWALSSGAYEGFNAAFNNEIGWPFCYLGDGVVWALGYGSYISYDYGRNWTGCVAPPNTANYNTWIMSEPVVNKVGQKIIYALAHNGSAFIKVYAMATPTVISGTNATAWKELGVCFTSMANKAGFGRIYPSDFCVNGMFVLSKDWTTGDYIPDISVCYDGRNAIKILDLPSYTKLNHRLLQLSTGEFLLYKNAVTGYNYLADKFLLPQSKDGKYEFIKVE